MKREIKKGMFIEGGNHPAVLYMTKAAGPVIERPKPKQKKPDFDQISAKLDQARARLEEIAETMRVKRLNR